LTEFNTFLGYSVRANFLATLWHIICTNQSQALVRVIEKIADNKILRQ